MSWSNYSEKKRCALLLTFLVVVLVLTFLIPVRRTTEARNSCNELLSSIEAAKSAPGRIEALQSKVSTWEKFMIENETRSEFRDFLFRASGEVSSQNSVRVNRLVLLGEKKEGDFILDTYELVLSGGFHQLLKSVNWFENQGNQGRVVSISFSLIRNRYTRNQELQARVIIQSITRYEKML